jgi:hypothetical protein
VKVKDNVNTITAQQVYDRLFYAERKGQGKTCTCHQSIGMEGERVTEGRVENVRVSVSVPRCPLECSR